jgi:hypothetical protein
MSQANEQAIQIPFPEAQDLQLRIVMGPGQIRVTPGTGQDWVTGSYRDPTGSIPLRVETTGNRARISQSVNLSVPKLKGTPRLDLQLGAAQPYALVFEGGANEMDGELGGLPLSRLAFRFGAGQASFRFTSPNPTAMENLQLSAGAAEVTMRGLGNANVAEIAIEGGAAAFHLDWGGTLTRDSRARINIGVAGVDITVPAATAARIAAKATLGGIDAGDGFVTRDGAFWTLAGANGQMPLLSVDATVALSGLKIRTS